MKKFLFTILSVFCIYHCFAEAPNLDSVKYYISRQSFYDEQKENRINKIKDEISKNLNNDSQLYPLYVNLFTEYRSYIYDSAYVCVEKLIDISSKLNDNNKIISSNVKLGFCYLSSGLFKEAFDILNSIDISECSNETRIEYYVCKSRFYYDLGDYNNSDEFKQKYNKIGNSIMDSALILLPEKSSQYWSAMGLKEMKSSNYNDALKAFQNMIETNDYTEHNLAIATSSIAYIFTLQGKKSEAKDYLIRSAIADVKSSTKETVALRNLAQLLYEEKNLNSANIFIRQAMKDASFYNARHRQLEIGNIMPIIEGERMNIIEKQRDRITHFSVFISILLIALIIALLIIRKSFKRLNLAKQEIQSVNDKLIEVNKIKNEYIGYFFNQNSEFIDKMEAYQKWVNKKVSNKQYEDLKYPPQRLTIRNEREKLFNEFDQIFLRLFPDFVEEFNNLLKPEERIQLKKGELLNTDLRIYALIRLGVNDNEKIAHFLDYSVNTIYTYKTKIKNKAIYSSEEFKQKVMEIKSY